MKKIALMIGLSLALTTTTSCTNETGGTLLGGAAGGLAGSAFGKGQGRLAMVVAGTLLGAFAGNKVGKTLDKADAMYAQKAANTAFETAPSGQAVAWRNPDSGHSGTVVPVRTFQDNSGQYCREFQQVINVGGQKQKAFGNACRQPDGNWKMVQ